MSVRLSVCLSRGFPGCSINPGGGLSLPVIVTSRRPPLTNEPPYTDDDAALLPGDCRVAHFVHRVPGSARFRETADNRTPSLIREQRGLSLERDRRRGVH